MQTGLCRTGKMLAVNHYDVKPDILCLGKALSGGLLPVSAVLANDEVMLTIRPGEHGSTYGGNPLACRVATESLKVLVDENLAENSEKQGNRVLAALNSMKQQMPFIKLARGKGLLMAVEIDNSGPGKEELAWDICMKLADKGEILP